MVTKMAAMHDIERSSSSDSEVFVGDGPQKAEEKIQQREADRSAEQKDEWPDCVQHDRQNENREAEQ